MFTSLTKYLGGFSMGGALSLYYTLKHRREFKATFVLSSFLNKSSTVYKVSFPIIFLSYENLFYSPS